MAGLLRLAGRKKDDATGQLELELKLELFWERELN